MTVIPAGALIRNREVPELGSGRVIAELEGGAAKVVFENSDEVREVRLQHADIVRQPLMPGTLVKVQRGDKVLEGEITDVDWPDSPRELCVYMVDIDGDEDTIFESQITPREPASSDPRDHFGALHWRGPFRFFSRWDMHRTISRWYEDSEGLPTMIGARIVPQLHEVHAVRNVLWDTKRRYLLADEDAQARLYEAGMVIQRMYASDPHLRVLVIAPGRRTHRWQTDLEQRFGNRSFVRVDASHLEANPQERWAAVSHNQRLIVSMGCLQQFPQACSELILGAGWDMVVFDDVHRLRHNDPAYDCLSAVSLESEHVLMLGALPETPDAASLAPMLALLRPGVYDATDTAAVQARLDGLDGDHLERRVVRSSRERLEQYDVTWNEREHEVLRYEPDESERAIAEHLQALPPESLGNPLQLALRGLYYAAAAGAPDRLFAMLDERLESIETTAGNAHQELLPFDLLGIDAGPREEEMLWDMIVAGASEMDGEGEWIAEAMSLVGQWHAESEMACARFEAAAGWIEAFLAEENEAEDDEEDDGEPPRKVLVACTSEQSAQDLSFFLESRFEMDAVEVVHARQPAPEQNDAVERFRRDATCRVLVCDETGAAGRDLSNASVIVHVEQPWSATRVERRISWVDQIHRNRETPVRSVVLVGPTGVEQALHELYDEVLGVYAATSYDREYTVADIDRDIWMAACAGQEAVGGLVARTKEKLDSLAEVDTTAYQAALDASDERLEADAEFADLLDFVDGVADSLPIRHWARMLGIQDHSAGPGIYDFKWHWKNVRRGLTGFDTSPEDVDFLMPQEQVEMMSGTFSRKRALRSENLEFFAPGHRFIDALIEDALAPTDGRTTVFARRLGPQNRGKAYLNVVALAQLDPEAWGAHDMPPGLINRAYRHLWPESISVPVEIDLKGRRDPRIVEDWDLIQKIEESYQGPEADQKIEYEIFIQAIEDIARFRKLLNEAVELALEKLKEDRAGLVDGAAAELGDDLAAEMEVLKAEAASDDEQRANEAAYELELLEKLIDSVRHEKLELDALAIVVAGTPQILMR
ncbi:DEAD/DEAH box helicase [Persicimonas caeni]|uniref:DEAD/DEAH box helicase n=1 Tax=Persicimonas caeni TaxID=2292766 RepID=A0A4Y6PQL5_PERCE|nr:helicase-related protein [Persicimonas caeni]QDG50317.1 DEAD/DEAH box helicase [Persicimonas caeni]QED31538.1 DEAD/DEAH box helicase [Persicimonas caeni]